MSILSPEAGEQQDPIVTECDDGAVSPAEAYLYEAVPELKTLREEGKTQFGIDVRTGVPDKKFLLSKRALEAVDRRYPGRKKFHLLDFRHMNAPNKFQLGAAVDIVVESTGVLAKQHLIPRFGVMVRVGGDEFAFILVDTPEADAEMSLFMHELRMEAQKVFNPDELDSRITRMQGNDPEKLNPDEVPPHIRKALEYAQYRDTMRSVRSGYLEVCSMQGTAPSEQDFRNWLVRQESDVAHVKRGTDWILEEVTVKRLGRLTKSTVRLCEPDFASVALADVPLTPQLMARAITGTDVALHANKIRSFDAPELEAQLAPELSENQRAEIDEHARQESTFGNGITMRNRLIAEMNAHPDRADALRLQLMTLDYYIQAMEAVDASSGLPGRESLKRERWPQDEAEIRYVLVELNFFGAINNTLSYAVGNQCLVNAGLALRGALQDSVHVTRARGGSFILAVPGSVDVSSLDATLSEASQALRTEILSSHSRAEYLKLEAIERRALDRRRGADTDAPVGELILVKERIVNREEIEKKDATLFDGLAASRL